MDNCKKKAKKTQKLAKNHQEKRLDKTSKTSQSGEHPFIRSGLNFWELYN